MSNALAASVHFLVLSATCVVAVGCGGGEPGEGMGAAEPAEATAQGAQAQASLSPIEQLGRELFFDQNLSKNRNQSCASCHAPAVGFTGGSTLADSEINAHGGVYPGSDPSLFGNRKPPSAAYAGDSAGLCYGDSEGWTGGMFWDGRATGAELGDPLAEQAKGPFLNPLEMALASAEQLRQRVKEGPYVALFDQVWGAGSVDGDAQQVYDRIGIAIAAYERSPEVNSYSSRFDAFWDRARAKRLDVTRINASNYTRYRRLGLSDTEVYGLAVFNDPAHGDCASCHSLSAGSRGYPMFTDYSYDNLGVPRNPENPFYSNAAYNPAGQAWVDTGLGGYLETVQPQSAAPEMGKMKVPTLRNVDRRPSSTFVRAYTHNCQPFQGDFLRALSSKSLAVDTCVLPRKRVLVTGFFGPRGWRLYLGSRTCPAHCKRIFPSCLGRMV